MKQFQDPESTAGFSSQDAALNSALLKSPTPNPYTSKMSECVHRRAETEISAAETSYNNRRLIDINQGIGIIIIAGER